MSFQSEFDRAVKAENDNPQGLPAEILTAMEQEIIANPEKYPAVHAALLGLKTEPYWATIRVRIDTDSTIAAEDRAWEIARDIQEHNADVPVTSVEEVQ